MTEPITQNDWPGLLAGFNARIMHLDRDRIVREALEFIGGIGVDRASLALLDEEQRRFPVGERLVRAGILGDFLVPLVAAGTSMGTLNCGSSSPDGIPPAIRGLLALLAPALAQALLNARLFEASCRSEAEARVAGERYRDFFENANDAIFLLDERHRYVDVNRRGVELFGYTREEYAGRSVLEFLPPEQAPRSEAAFRELVERGEYHSFAGRMRAKDGRWLDIEVNSSAILRDGAFVGSRDIVRDVTERVQAERELAEREAVLRQIVETSRRSEERFRLAMRGANDGLWDWDLSTDDVYYSPRWKSMLGYAEDELENRLDTWKRLVLPEDRGRTMAVVSDLLEGRRDTFEAEFRMRHKDGSFRHILSRAFFADNPAGGNRRLVGTHVDVSERTQAELRLKKSEAQLLESQQVAMIGGWSWDLVTDALDWSEETFRRFDMDPSAFTPSVHYFLERVHPDDQAAVRQAMQDSLERGAPYHIEPRITNESGRQWVLEGFGRVERDGAGRAVRFAGTAQDVTARKQMELALRNSERLYRNLVETTAAVAWEVDYASMQFTYIGPQVERLTGYPPEQWTGFGFWAERIHPDDREQSVRFCQAETALGQEHTFEYRMLTAGGGIIWVRDVVSVVTHQGEPVTLRGFFIDITATKLAEEQIRRSEQFIRGILDSVDEGFIVVDRDFRIVTANKAYCGQVGRTLDEVTGQHCYQVSHRSSRPCHEQGEECAVRQVFATGKPHAALHRHPDGAGQLLFVETKAYPILDAEGRVASVIETITNITERHLLEEERLKTQKLESIGTLAGGIAHDFNNLLQGVFGYISLAKMTIAQPEKSLSMLTQAEQALHLSVNLTSQLLTFSKGGQPAKKRVALAPVVENAAKFGLSGSRSDFRLDAQPGLWAIDADAGQIGQVVQNIVLNADQAMPLGGTVSIEARNAPAGVGELPAGLPAGNYVRIAIADTGVGIPERYLSRIFDPYFTTKEKGSGLGLATSYSIIRNHGGGIEVRSAVDRGTTFLVYLPASPAAAEHDEPAKQTGAVRTGRFLLMDDEDVVRAVTGELLGALGHEVEFAEHGADALERWRAARDAGRPFDAVILDLTIRGGMGGVETLRALRALDSSIKAIVSSGYSDDAAIANYRALGFRAFLKKPYNLGELRGLLDTVLA